MLVIDLKIFEVHLGDGFQNSYETYQQDSNIDNILVVANVYFESNKIWGYQDLIKQPGQEPYVYI